MKLFFVFCVLCFVSGCGNKNKKVSIYEKANLFAATLAGEFVDSCIVSYVAGIGNKKDILFSVYPWFITDYWREKVTPYRRLVVRDCVIKDSIDLFSRIRFRYIIEGDTTNFDYLLSDTTFKKRPATIEAKAKDFFWALGMEEKTYYSTDKETGNRNIIFSIRQYYDEPKTITDNCARFLKSCILNDSAKYFTNMNFYYTQQRKEINYPLTDKIFNAIQ